MQDPKKKLRRRRKSLSKLRDARRQQRRLRTELLESRVLLAGDVNPLHNAWQPTDIDGDGRTTFKDVTVLLDELSRGGVRTGAPSAAIADGEGEATPDKFFDVNADGHVAPNDAGKLINLLNLMGEGEHTIDGPRVRFRLTARDQAAFDAGNPDANIINSVSSGEEFAVRFTAEDLRDADDVVSANNRGVAGAYADIEYDPTVFKAIKTVGEITAATNAEPVELTSADHGLSVGDDVYILGVGGMTELNGSNQAGATLRVLEVTSTDTFTLSVRTEVGHVPLDGTSFGAYAGGGTWSLGQATRDPQVTTNHGFKITYEDPGAPVPFLKFPYPNGVFGVNTDVSQRDVPQGATLFEGDGIFNEVGGFSSQSYIDAETFVFEVSLQAKEAHAEDDAEQIPENTMVTLDVLGNDKIPSGATQIELGASDFDPGSRVLVLTRDLGHETDDDNFEVEAADQELIGIGGIGEPTLTVVGSGALTLERVLNVPVGHAAVIENGQIKYTPPTGFNGLVTFQYEVSNGSGSGDVDTGDVVIEVLAVNDAPILQAGDLTAGTFEDTALTLNLSDLINNAGNPDSTTITDADAGDPVGGVAVISTNEPGGASFEFSVDGAQSFSSLGTVSDSSALLLPADAILRYNPAGDDTDVTLAFRAWDQTSGVAGTKVDASATGGQTAFSVASDTIAIVVDDQPDPPVISDAVGGQQVDDNATIQPFSTLTISDLDSPPEVLDVEIQVDVPAAGTLATDGSLVDEGAGRYTFSGTADAATILMRSLLYTPVTNRLEPTQSETVTFSLTVADQTVSTADAVDSNTTVDINSINDDPSIPAGQEFSVSEAASDGSLVGTVAMEDVDVNSAAQDFAIVGGDPAGVFAIHPTSGEITVADETELDRETQDRFELLLTVADNHGGTSSAETVVVNVQDVNDTAPVVTAGQAFAVAENSAGGSVLGTVLASDVDLTGGPLQDWQITGGSGSGLFEIDAVTGAVTVALGADLDHEAADVLTLEVTVSDGANTSDPTEVSVSLGDVNEAPTISGTGANASINDNETSQVFSGVSIADEDDPAQTLVATINFDESNGTLTGAGISRVALDTFEASGTASQLVTALNQAVFVPTENQVDPMLTVVTTFTLAVDDGEFEVSDNNASIVVTSLNDAPSANDQGPITVSNVEPVTIVFDADDVDTDDNLDTLLFTIISGPTDNDGATDDGAVAANNPPGVDAGSFTFDPAADFAGLVPGESRTVTFTYQATDSQNAESRVATVTLVVVPNNPPTAENDAFSASEDETNLTGDLFADNGNGIDSDIEGDAFAVAGFQGVSDLGATVSVNSDGTFTYNATTSATLNSLAINEAVDDHFTYTIQDAAGGQNTATVTVTVSGRNDAPTANDDDLDIDEDLTLHGDLATDNGHGVDSDPDVNGNAPDDVLIYSLVSGQSTANGMLNLNTDGSFEYTPHLDFHGTDSFDYQVEDGNGGSDTATVTITVNSINDEPVATDVTQIVSREGGPVVIAFAATDVDNAPGDLSFDIFDPLANGEGTATNNSDGTFTFDPGSDFDGLAPGASAVVDFQYRAHDGELSSNDATVTITVLANQLPVAETDHFTTDEETQISGNVLNDNGNGADSDPDGDLPLSVTAESLQTARGASVTLNIDGSFTYDPAGSAVLNQLPLGAAVTDSFSYTLTDAKGGHVEGNVEVLVNGLNDAPIAQNDILETAEDTLFSGAVTADNGNGSDADLDVGVDGGPADSPTFSVVPGEEVQHGTLSFQPDGTFTYAPHENFFGTDQFIYEMNDGNGGADVATVVINVTQVNDDPVIGADQLVALANGGLQNLDILSNDRPGPNGDTPSPFNEDDQTLSLASISGLTILQNDHGTSSAGDLVQNGDSVDYTPATDFVGRVSFDYTVEDSAGGQASATAFIDVVAFTTSEFKGHVFDDLDGNGEMDPGEPALGGVTLHLTGSNLFGDVDVLVTTAADGAYSISEDQHGNLLAPSDTYRLVAGDVEMFRDSGMQIMTPGVDDPSDTESNQFHLETPAARTITAAIGAFGGAAIEVNFGSVRNFSYGPLGSDGDGGIVFGGSDEFWFSVLGDFSDTEQIQSLSLELPAGFGTASGSTVVTVSMNGAARQLDLQDGRLRIIMAKLGSDGEREFAFRYSGTHDDFLNESLAQAEGEMAVDAEVTDLANEQFEQLAAQLRTRGESEFAADVDAVFTEGRWLS